MPRHRAAAEKNLPLAAAFRGERLDALVRASVRQDRQLAGRLRATPRGRRGPDFIDRETGRWYDVTTERQWGRHLTRYSDEFGDDAVGVLYK